MEKSLFLIANIHEDCVERGHHFFDPAVVDVSDGEVVLISFFAIDFL